MYVTYDLQVMSAYNIKHHHLGAVSIDEIGVIYMVGHVVTKEKQHKNDKRLMSHDIMNFWEIGVVSPHAYLYLLYKMGYMTKRGMETAMAEIENKLANSPDVDTMDFIVRLCDVVETYRSRQIPYELDLRYNLKIMIGVGKYFLRVLKFRG